MSDIKELVRQSLNKIDFVKCLITDDTTIQDLNKAISLLKEVATSLENIKEKIEE